MAQNPYKDLNSKVSMAREQYAKGELNREEFRKVIKGFYEDYLELEEEKKSRDREEMIKNLRFTD